MKGEVPSLGSASLLPMMAPDEQLAYERWRAAVQRFAEVEHARRAAATELRAAEVALMQTIAPIEAG